MKVIDVHTHMLNDAYLALLKKHGGGYKLKKLVGGQTGVVKDGAPFMTLMPGMFDYELRYDNMPACREKISERPSAYLRKIFYDSVVFQQESLELAIKVGGEDKLLYGSDYPHNIGDMKGCLARVDALPAATRDAVRGGNALRIFRL